MSSACQHEIFFFPVQLNSQDDNNVCINLLQELQMFMTLLIQLLMKK